MLNLRESRIMESKSVGQHLTVFPTLFLLSFNMHFSTRMTGLLLVKRIADLIQLGVPVFGPAVLVHVVTQIVVAGILLSIQPVEEIAFDLVLHNGHAAALLHDDVGELQARQRIVQVLAEIAQVGALLFGIAVIFPEGGNDLAVGRLRAEVVDQDPWSLNI